MQICVKNWKNNKISLDVAPSETLESVKAKIEEEKGHSSRTTIYSLWWKAVGGR